MKVDIEAARKAVTDLLIAIGEDPARSGLQDTPDRVARFWQEFVDYDPGKYVTLFENENESKTDQMVVVGPMRVWSLCEHHLLPFYTDVIAGYLPDKHILGLSKFARIAHRHAHQLQVQERLVQKIADEVALVTGTEHVAVVGYGEHLCMTMRGIRTPSKMVSSVMYGAFRDAPQVRKEFFDLSRTLHLGTN
jgi:GTP cyclohydrolase IA